MASTRPLDREVRVRSLAPQSRVRPGRVRTYVRAKAAVFTEDDAPRGDRRVPHVRSRRSGSWRMRPGRRQPWKTLQTLRPRRLGDLDSSLRRARRPHRQAARHRSRGRSSEMLVEDSTYPARAPQAAGSTATGLKERRCELCGQGEDWRGTADGADPRPRQRRRERQPAREPPDRVPELRRDARHALRHATFRDTRSRSAVRAMRRRASSGVRPRPALLLARLRRRGTRGVPQAARLAARKVERPPYEQLVREIEASSYVAVGRRYGVSDNAIRKWIRAYERELGAAPLPRAA